MPITTEQLAADEARLEQELARGQQAMARLGRSLTLTEGRLLQVREQIAAEAAKPAEVAP